MSRIKRWIADTYGEDVNLEELAEGVQNGRR